MKKPRNMKAGAFAIAVLFLAMTASTANAILPIRKGLMPVPGGELETTQQPAGGQSSQQSTGDPPYVPPTYFTTSNMSSEFIGIGATGVQNYPDDPSGQDELYPPLGDRHSFLYLTYIWEIVNDSIKIVGLSFNAYMKADGTPHEAHWFPATVYITLEGDHAGSYYYPEFFFNTTVSGTGGWFPGIAIQVTWDPAHDRITYFHISAEYFEDGQFIRHVNRGFEQSWNNNNG
jgi:hypothetical protein